MTDTRRRAAAFSGFAAVGFALGTPLLGAAARPGYVHRAQFISELGETGAANGLLVSLLGFAPTGFLLLVFLALATPALPRSRGARIGLLAFASVGVAYLVSAIARCDAGCPGTGSAAQTVHNLFGALEYIGACVGLVLLGAAFKTSPAWRAYAPLCVACAVFVAVGFGAVLTPSLAGLRGLSQRIAEAGVFVWVAVMSAAVLRAPDPRHGGSEQGRAGN